MGRAHVAQRKTHCLRIYARATTCGWGLIEVLPLQEILIVQTSLTILVLFLNVYILFVKFYSPAIALKLILFTIAWFLWYLRSYLAEKLESTTFRSIISSTFIGGCIQRRLSIWKLLVHSLDQHVAYCFIPNVIFDYLLKWRRHYLLFLRITVGAPFSLTLMPHVCCVRPTWVYSCIHFGWVHRSMEAYCRGLSCLLVSLKDLVLLLWMLLFLKKGIMESLVFMKAIIMLSDARLFWVFDPMFLSCRWSRRKQSETVLQRPHLIGPLTSWM